jgi:tight adherence protein C
MPLLIVSLMVFVGIASLLFFVFYASMPKKTILEERIEGITPTPSIEAIPFEADISSWQKFLGRLGKNVPMRPQDYGKYQKMFVAAGLKKERVAIFMGSKLLLTAILPLAYLALYGLPVEKDVTTRILMTTLCAIGGYLLPTYWLRNRMQKRQLRIFHDLPDLLDLMTVCVEAGLSMDASMIKVCEDQQFRKGPLAREINIAVQETRAGKPRLEALRDMGERTMVDDLKSFAAMLIQTEKLGTSLAQSLRVFSDSLRTIRRQRAEEAAAKTAVKLVFPLVFFIFPAILVVILGPGMLRISRFFTEM